QFSHLSDGSGCQHFGAVEIPRIPIEPGQFETTPRKNVVESFTLTDVRSLQQISNRDGSIASGCRGSGNNQQLRQCHVVTVRSGSLQGLVQNLLGFGFPMQSDKSSRLSLVCQKRKSEVSH